jgi:transposase
VESRVLRYIEAVSTPVPQASIRPLDIDVLLSEIERRDSDLAAATQSVIASKDSIIADKDKRIQTLQEQLRLMVHDKFGRRNESLPVPDGGWAGQYVIGPDGSLVFVPAGSEPETEIRTVAVPAHVKSLHGHGRAALPENLPRKTEIVDLPESQRTCSCCSEAMVVIGSETSEQLRFTKPEVWVQRTERLKYACKHCSENGVSIAPVPEQFVDKGLAGLDLILWIVVSKYVDHLPLYRIHNQIKRWTNGALDLSEATMIGWIDAVFNALDPIQQANHRQLSCTGWVHMDETHLKVQDGEKDSEGRGKTSTHQLWALLGRDRMGQTLGVSFTHEDTRSTVAAFRLMKDVRGVFITDRLPSYDAALEQLRKSCQAAGKVLELAHAHCWAHVRRKFNEALLVGQKDARQALDRIAEIYRAESACQDAVAHVADLDEREELLLEHRRTVVRPKMDELFAWVKAHDGSLQTSRMQDALRYTLNAEAGLKVVLDQAGCDLDNNAVERAIRTVAIGRKNWMFAGSPKGAKRLACLLSILGSCRILSINVDEYLSEVLMESKRRLKAKEADFEDLTPWRWKQERDQARDDATKG